MGKKHKTVVVGGGLTFGLLIGFFIKLVAGISTIETVAMTSIWCVAVTTFLFFLYRKERSYGDSSWDIWNWMWTRTFVLHIYFSFILILLFQSDLETLSLLLGVSISFLIANIATILFFILALLVRRETPKGKSYYVALGAGTLQFLVVYALTIQGYTSFAQQAVFELLGRII